MKKFFAGIFLVASVAVFAPAAFAKAKPVKKPVKHAPVYYSTTRGATAECEDGTLYFGKHVKGACSLHDGVMQWFK